MRKLIIVVLVLALTLTGVVMAAGNAFGKNKAPGSNMGEIQEAEAGCTADAHGLTDLAGYDVYKVPVTVGEGPGECLSGFAWYTCNGDVFFECTDVDVVITV